MTTRHLRACGYCLSGARQWFRRQGLDWRAFVREGIDSDRLRATGDAMAIRVAEHAEQ